MCDVLHHSTSIKFYIVIPQVNDDTLPDKYQGQERRISLRMSEVDSEQKKYSSFWVGIQRRVAIKKDTPLIGKKLTFSQVKEIQKLKVSSVLIHH